MFVLLSLLLGGVNLVSYNVKYQGFTSHIKNKINNIIISSCIKLRDY